MQSEGVVSISFPLSRGKVRMGVLPSINNKPVVLNHVLYLFQDLVFCPKILFVISKRVLHLRVPELEVVLVYVRVCPFGVVLVVEFEV